MKTPSAIHPAKRWPRMHPLGLALSAVLMLLCTLPSFADDPGPSATDKEASPTPARVVYVNAQVAYLNQGSLDGIHVGDLLPISRHGQIIAQLRVEFVADHHSQGSIFQATRPPRRNDIVLGSSQPQSSPPATRKRNDQELETSTLAERWRSALQNETRPLVAYHADSEETSLARFAGWAETRYQAYATSGEPQTVRHEQRVSLLARGEDLGTEGLSLRIRGDALIRYDNQPDRYQLGTRAIPLVRELRLAYQSETLGLFAEAGRFYTHNRMIGLIDGATLGYTNKRWDIALQGGLRPDAVDLIPQSDHGLAALSFSVRPLRDPVFWQLSTSYLSEITTSSLDRHSVALDNRVTWNERLRINQTATLDILSSQAVTEPSPQTAFSDGSLSLSSEPTAGILIDLSARYTGEPLTVEEAKDAEDSWRDAYLGHSRWRSDASARFNLVAHHCLKPYAYWEDLRYETAPGVFIGAAGLSYIFEETNTRAQRYEVMLDYGQGNHEQRSNLEFQSYTALLERLWLSGGVGILWSHSSDSYLSTFQNLVDLRLEGEPVESLQLSVSLQAAVDYAPIRKAIPLASFWQGGAGVRYAW